MAWAIVTVHGQYRTVIAIPLIIIFFVAITVRQAYTVNEITRLCWW